jgi:hypothetical protein
VGSTQTDAMKAAVEKYQALPEAEETLTPEAIQALTSYALTSAEYIDRVADRFRDPQEAPAQRVSMYLSARRRLQGLARSIRFNESLETALQLDDLTREATKARKARVVELTAQGMDPRLARRQASLEMEASLAEKIGSTPHTEPADEGRLVYRAMLALDTMLSAFPPEVRAQVGGFMQIAQLKTQKARAKFLAERAEKAMAATEAFLQKELRTEIGAIFDRSRPTGGASWAPGATAGLSGRRSMP